MQPIRAILSFFFIALFAGNVQSQPIEVKVSQGELTINGAPIDPGSIPESLRLGNTSFRLQSAGSFPMRVEINENHYQIWQTRITEAVDEGRAHFKVSFSPDHSYVSIESVAAWDLPYESIAQALAVDDLSPQDQFMERITSVQQDRVNATKVVELSNYLANVQGASTELFDLLRHEWREELQARNMAGSIRSMENGKEREEAIEELKEKLEEIFMMKQENRQMEIQHMEMEIERMEERLRERFQAKDRLIDARLNELLGRYQ